MTESPDVLYERERAFNKGDSTRAPSFGICFSGGGNRSAAFAIGVLRALHESTLLDKVDVVSAVSGGSYALSWYLLQPFYHRTFLDSEEPVLGRVLEEMFDLEGPFQRHLEANAKPLNANSPLSMLLMLVLTLPFDLAVFNALRVLSTPLRSGSNAARFANLLNAQSSARDSYRQGIQRTYHEFPDAQRKAPAEKLSFWDQSFIYSAHLNLTESSVPPVSVPVLSAFAQRAGLPGFVFNTTVCPPHPDDQVPLGHRIFEIGPMGFGSDSCGYLAWEETEGHGWEPGAKVEKDWIIKARRSREDGTNASGLASPFATIRNFNVAPAISGAALSGTNITHRKSRYLLWLLNLGLEYIVPSPADRSRPVRLSDGGHSENLGAYTLLRRGCRNILIVDAEHDPSYQFGAYRKLKGAARDDLGIEITIPLLDDVLSGHERFIADAPILTGSTKLADGKDGSIRYLKLSMHKELLGDQAEIIAAYANGSSAFPQEPTTDQYFQAAQFRAYRALGYAIGRTLPPDVVS